MNDTVIQVANLSKRYRLGVVGTGTLAHDLNRWWAKVRGRPDPTLKVGQAAVGSGQKPVEGDGLPTPDYMWALKDLSFEVRRGEILGIIGRNGAGKSTVLKILSRVTAPTSGEVRVRGRIASLLEVGTGFHPELTGRENIFLNGAILGMKKAETVRKFDEIVAFSGVEQYIDTPVKRYSSGMYVRLAFAVAAHLDPEILVLDEVLAVGDAAFQKKCLGKMGDVAKKGKTVLFVSHNMASVRNLCGSTLWLEKGCFSGFGTTDEVVRDYLAAEERGEADTPHVAPISARVALKRIWTTTHEGVISSALDVTKPFSVNIAFDVRERVSDTDIGVWVRNIRDFPVCCANLSELSGGELPLLEPGQYVGSFRVPALFLVPDVYRLMAKAHVPNVRTEDHIPNACEFSVVETGSAVQRYDQPWRFGVVLGNFTWTLLNEG